MGQIASTKVHPSEKKQDQPTLCIKEVEPLSAERQKRKETERMVYMFDQNEEKHQGVDQTDDEARENFDSHSVRPRYSGRCGKAGTARLECVYPVERCRVETGGCRLAAGW